MLLEDTEGQGSSLNMAIRSCQDFRNLSCNIPIWLLGHVDKESTCSFFQHLNPDQHPSSATSIQSSSRAWSSEATICCKWSYSFSEKTMVFLPHSIKRRYAYELELLSWGCRKLIFGWLTKLVFQDTIARNNSTIVGAVGVWWTDGSYRAGKSETCGRSERYHPRVVSFEVKEKRSEYEGIYCSHRGMKFRSEKYGLSGEVVLIVWYLSELVRSTRCGGNVKDRWFSSLDVLFQLRTCWCVGNFDVKTVKSTYQPGINTSTHRLYRQR
jgi:hypothetical protein